MATSPLTQSSPPPNDVASDLKRISSYWPTILNNRDIAHESPLGQQIRACIAPNFKARIDGYAEVFDWDGLCGVWQKEVTDFPACRLELADIHVVVEEKHGAATVYLDLDMIGLANVTLKAFTELSWVRTKRGKWLIWRFNGVRGHSGNAGFV